ncbi:MAG: VOC family protein [Rhodobacter sp.]|nr:VOC family protein [Rhodobacter sp.]MCA3521626.1 VOC family protein [Rhodobacter sp.]MCA3527325.1 VOC family protein [Rhodobacter sp.]MCA3529791.1 VOC family protein [Rhodobacter sp.]MCA3532552.1 VOC family protein [Rhodobacter sp.]
MAKAIHTMIRVLDEARSIAFYRQAFGLTVADRLDFDSFTLVYLSNPETTFELELTVNKGRTQPYDLGDGYGHLAVSVADVAAEHARLTEAGLSPRKIVDFAPAGTVIARFFFIADPDGYQIEVLERGGRYL